MDAVLAGMPWSDYALWYLSIVLFSVPILVAGLGYPRALQRHRDEQAARDERDWNAWLGHFAWSGRCEDVPWKLISPTRETDHPYVDIKRVLVRP